MDRLDNAHEALLSHSAALDAARSSLLRPAESKEENAILADIISASLKFHSDQYESWVAAMKGLPDDLRSGIYVGKCPRPTPLEDYTEDKSIGTLTEPLTCEPHCAQTGMVEPLTPPTKVQSLQDRMQKMGAVPALGSGMTLPRLQASQLRSLQTTASPAAREVLRGKLNNPDFDAAEGPSTSRSAPDTKQQAALPDTPDAGSSGHDAAPSCAGAALLGQHVVAHGCAVRSPVRSPARLPQPEPETSELGAALARRRAAS